MIAIWSRIIVGAALAGAALPAQAQSPSWSIEGSLASEYVSKGVGRSGGDPHFALQLQGSTSGPAYAGLWVGSLKSPLNADGEAQVYLGWRERAGNWSLEFRPSYKALLGDSGAGQWEVRADASRPVGSARLRLRLEYAGDGYGTAEGSTWAEAQLSQPAGPDWTIVGGFGVREQEVGRDYSAWNFGVQRRLGDRVTAGLRWIDTNQTNAGPDYDGRLVFNLAARFR